MKRISILLVLCLLLIVRCTVTTTKIDDPKDLAEAELVMNEFFSYLKKDEIHHTYKLFADEYYKFADTNFLYQTFKDRELSYGKLKEMEVYKFKSKVIRGRVNKGVVELTYNLRYEKGNIQENFILGLQKDGHFRIGIFETLNSEKTAK